MGTFCNGAVSLWPIVEGAVTLRLTNHHPFSGSLCAGCSSRCSIQHAILLITTALCGFMRDHFGLPSQAAILLDVSACGIVFRLQEVLFSRCSAWHLCFFGCSAVYWCILAGLLAIGRPCMHPIFTEAPIMLCSRPLARA